MPSHRFRGHVLTIALVVLSLPQLGLSQPPASQLPSGAEPPRNNDSLRSPTPQVLQEQLSGAEAHHSATQQPQPYPQSPPVIPSPDVAARVYEVTVTELRWEADLPTELTHEQILSSREQLIQNGKVQHVETIRLTVLDGQKSTVQVGRNVGVVTGQTTGNPRGGSARSVTYQPIGTLLNVLPRGQGDRVALNLEYSRSYHTSPADDDLPPEIVNLQVSTVLPVTLGKETLVANHLTKSGMMLVVIVR